MVIHLPIKFAKEDPHSLSLPNPIHEGLLLRIQTPSHPLFSLPFLPKNRLSPNLSTRFSPLFQPPTRRPTAPNPLHKRHLKFKGEPQFTFIKQHQPPNKSELQFISQYSRFTREDRQPLSLKPQNLAVFFANPSRTPFSP